MFKKLLNIFKPVEFNTPYLFMLNQFGHISISFLFSYLTNAPKIILLFWLVWEIIHLAISKNYKDFVEDLMFESIGAVLFMLLFTATFNIWLAVALTWLLVYTLLRFKL